MKSTYALVALLDLCLSSLLLAQHAPVAERNPFAGDVSAAQDGKRTYVNACQICHGGEGRGGRGPALSTRDFRHGGEDWQLFQTIRDGVPGTQMPGFSMSPEELWQVVITFSVIGILVSVGCFFAIRALIRRDRRENE